MSLFHTISENIIYVLHMYTHKATFIFYSRGLDYKAKPLLKAMLINKDFLTWLLIGWQRADSQSDARFENIS